MTRRFVPPGDGPANDDTELPACPCEHCGTVTRPRLEVVPLAPRTDEYRYLCLACGKPVVTFILGDDDAAIEARAVELGGWGVEVTDAGAQVRHLGDRSPER